MEYWSKERRFAEQGEIEELKITSPLLLPTTPTLHYSTGMA
jgi:hypothetical protein